jgi:hypothetical protein
MSIRSFCVLMLSFFFSSLSFALSGGGTEANPYIISNRADFDAFCADQAYWAKNVHVRLEADIDLSDTIYDKAPIAHCPPDVFTFSGTPYEGHFDGNYHKIIGLTINGGNYLGLFGALNNDAVVEKLGIEDCRITAMDKSGNRCIGGIAGQNSDSVIRYCYVTGLVYASGYFIGGICGDMLWHGAVVHDCYSLAVTLGTLYVGGISGSLDFNASVIRCHAAGLITGGLDTDGGIAGYSTFHSYTISDCLWDTESTKIDRSLDGEGKTTDQMRLEETFTDIGWDFVNIWRMSHASEPGNGYPVLSWQASNPDYSLSGTGTTYDPFVIASRADFDAFCGNPHYWNDNISLETDLDLSGTVYNMAPIAPDLIVNEVNHEIVFDGVSFDGYFNGNGHTISGLTINSGDNDYIGLFGYIRLGKVVNLNVADFEINGDGRSIGGFCGMTRRSTFEKITTSGTITGGESTNYIGGIFGAILYGIYDSPPIKSHIRNCSANVTIDVEGSEVGGFSGIIYGIPVSNCSVGGFVSGKYSVGGFAGTTNYPILYESFSTADVNGVTGVGGFTGYNSGNQHNNYSDVKILKCYAAGNVTGSTACIGGFVGKNSGLIEESFATGNVYGGTEKVGGFNGENYLGTIRNCYSTGTVQPEPGTESVGGFCGANAKSAEIRAYLFDCFWNTQTSGMLEGYGSYDFDLERYVGIPSEPGVCVGLTSGQMRTQANFTDAGWDFVGENINGTDDIWLMSSLNSDFSGFPILKFQQLAVIPASRDHTWGTQNGTITVSSPLNWQAAAGDSWIQIISGSSGSGGGEIEYSTAINTQEPRTGTITVSSGIIEQVFTINQDAAPVVLPPYILFGEGTESEPYLILNRDDFDGFCTNESYWNEGVYVRLEADIDLSDTIYDQSPIAPGPESHFFYYGSPYFGHFDGNYHKITGLTIRGGNFLGLFGKIGENSVVENLALLDCNINPPGSSIRYLGSIAGVNEAGTIRYCYASGMVRGAARYLGGLVGELRDGGLIHDSYSLVHCSGSSKVGGIVGSIGSSNSTINRCYAAGIIMAIDDDYFGIAGHLSGTSYSILNSFWDIEATVCENSFFGEGKTTDQMRSQQPFVDAGWDFANIWKMSHPSEFENGYPVLWWQQSSPNYSLPGRGTKNDPFVIQNRADFDAFCGNPHFWKCNISLETDLDLSDTVYDMAPIAPDLIVNYIESSIFFDGISFNGYFNGNGHTISGLTIDSADNDYVGLFGYVRRGKVVNLNVADYQINGSGRYIGGLCGMTRVSTFENITTSGTITGGETTYVGGIFGAIFANNYNTPPMETYIRNCHADVTIDVQGSVAGCFSGEIRSASVVITNCSTGGFVSGRGSVGGFAGQVGSPRIYECFSTADVNAQRQVGGFAGYNGGSQEHATVKILKCYSTGNVTGSQYRIGGFVGGNNGLIEESFSTGNVYGGTERVGGFNGENYLGTVRNCYSTGTVQPEPGADRVGGFCGVNAKRSEIRAYLFDCFWNTQTSGMSGGYTEFDYDLGYFVGLPSNPGICVGLTSEQMRTQANFTDAGWDFLGESVNGTDDNWTMSSTGSVFNGFPIHAFTLFNISPLSRGHGHISDTGSISVNTALAWSASSSDTWLTITSQDWGVGDGVVNYSVSANGGQERSGTITFSSGGFTEVFTVSQLASASLSVSPGFRNHSKDSGTGQITVTSDVSWSAAANEPWITITSGSNGYLDGTISYSILANPGTNRSGTITVTGQGVSDTFIVYQSSGFVLSLNPTSEEFPPQGGSGNIDIISNVSWTISKDQDWITVHSRPNGSGSDIINYSVDENTSGVRSGTITISGGGMTHSFTINQLSPSIIISPTSRSYSNAGGTGSVSVASNVSWTAEGSHKWITVIYGETGSGNGTVEYQVQPNTGAARSGSVTVSGGGAARSLTITQSAASFITINPVNRYHTHHGGQDSINVTSNVSWAAVSEKWITIVNGETGSDDGTVEYQVQPNTGGYRSGIISIGGGGVVQTFTIQQDGPALQLNPSSSQHTSANDDGSIGIKTNINWTAHSSKSWISIKSDTSGSGNYTLLYSISENTGFARSGTITVSGDGLTEIFTITQQGPVTVNGDGTEENPYQISSAQHLEAVNSDLQAHYVLVNDIDLYGLSYDRALIAPNTGTSAAFEGTPFAGVFDAKGFAVKNLTINGGTLSHIGIFGRISASGTVRNLGLENINISGYQNLGGVAGENSGLITGCFADSQVTATAKAGGLAGLNNEGTITDSYSAGNISGTWIIGGLAGENYKGKILRCYSAAVPTGSSYVGGFVAAVVTGDGYQDSANFWDEQISQTGDSAMGKPKTTAQMQDSDTFLSASWDLVNETENGRMQLWYVLEDHYPRLYWQALAGDVNYDGVVDSQDITAFSSEWLFIEKQDERLQADINKDNFVDLMDFAAMSESRR